MVMVGKIKHISMLMLACMRAAHMAADFFQFSTYELHNTLYLSCFCICFNKCNFNKLCPFTPAVTFLKTAVTIQESTCFLTGCILIVRCRVLLQPWCLSVSQILCLSELDKERLSQNHRCHFQLTESQQLCDWRSGLSGLWFNQDVSTEYFNIVTPQN